MKASLYINSSGYPVSKHSYSGGSDFRTCQKYYELKRPGGWTEKEQKASMKFGIAIEEAVRYYHESGGDVEGAVTVFFQGPKGDTKQKGWQNYHESHPKKIEITYSKTDGNWNTLAASGEEMIRLYDLRYPIFPYEIPDPIHSFQIEKSVEVYPGTSLAGIEFISYIDIKAKLKKTSEPLIIDCKVSGADMPDLLTLDPQLLAYAHVWNIPLAGFLWFEKTGRSFEKGSVCSLLAGNEKFKTGQQVYVIKVQKEDVEKFQAGGLWIVDSPAIIEEMEKQFVGEKKEVKAARQEFINNNAMFVLSNKVTKQKVSFMYDRFPKPLMDEAWEIIKSDIVSIARASKNNNFLRTGMGVRFPHNACTSCVMRGICSGNNTLRDALVERKQSDEFEIGDE